MTAHRLSPYDQHWADWALRHGRAPKFAGRIMTLDPHDDFAQPAPSLAKRSAVTEPIIEKKKQHT